MKAALYILLCLTGSALAESDVHMAETKTQVELESALSRLIPSQQFLIQVSSDISTRYERRLVEGESFAAAKGETAAPKFEAMPGFMPEVFPARDVAGERAPERQIFRMVERPVLEALRVRVDFDEKVPADRVLRAKTMVKDYLSNHYPAQGQATFGRLPMLTPDPNSVVKEPSWIDTFFKEYWMWIVGIVSAWLVWMSFRKPTAPLAPQTITRRVKRALTAPVAAMTGPARGDLPSSRDRKKLLLDRFLRKSDSFRLYYQNLTEARQDELAGLLAGPAFDSLMDGLGIFRAAGKAMPPGNEEECLDQHELEFDDYARARDWQEQQPFGFLHQLSNDQLNTLMTHASPLAACVMLRFLKPSQSAYVLDNMSPARRSEIFSEVPQVQMAALNDLNAIEKEIRANAQRMPRAIFGSPKDDLEYWGKVLAESDQQEGILKALERANPDLGPSLKKFRFKLEDAMTLDQSVLQRVLGDVDNEELSLALVTLPEESVQMFLSALGSRRRDLVAGQVLANKSASAAETRPARLALTKKFRDAMAA